MKNGFGIDPPIPPEFSSNLNFPNLQLVKRVGFEGQTNRTREATVLPAKRVHFFFVRFSWFRRSIFCFGLFGNNLI